MRLPGLSSDVGKNKMQIVSFGGINYSRGCREGELSDSEGLSSAQYPCLSQRKGRKTLNTYNAPTALYASADGLCVVEGTDLLYNGEVVGQVSPGAKQFAAINTKIVVWPDKLYYDTTTGELSSLDVSFQGVEGMVSFTSNTLTIAENGWRDLEAEDKTLDALTGTDTVTVYTGAAVDPAAGTLTMSGESSKAVKNLAAGDLIRTDCEDGDYLEVNRCRQNWDGTWSILGTLHRATAFKCPELDTLFQEGDAVEISGCVTLEAVNGSHIIRAVEGRTLTFDQNAFTLEVSEAGGTDTPAEGEETPAAGEETPAAGQEAQADTEEQTVKEQGAVLIRRRVPDLMCICECDNRLWGAEGHTIWASALGDPRNFYVYDGVSTDSYAVAVGTEGEFTACIAYSSTVLFWKEDCVHKVLGNYPAQYEIYTYKVPGVQKGAEKSLCIINETLFYKGRAGVYAYAGGTPELLAECFGTRRFSGGVAGTDGERYYISMMTETGAWELYILDTTRGIWLREDDTHAVDWAYLDGTLYYLDGRTGKIMMTGQDRGEEGPIEWSATLCPFNETVHGRKGYSRLYLRADLEAGAWIKAEVSADGAPFRQVYLGHDDHAKTLQIPILPTRCDAFSVRLSGKGECVVKSFVREFSIGSEY